jgi:hydroxymethylpyrimidine kinase/phosphomethylpyrimidine kinase
LILPKNLPISLPVALTIAGFDPSGGAGVLADAKTFAAFGFQATAAITSVTFQSSNRVFGAVHQTGETVRAQVTPLLEDCKIMCAKTGMLPTREVVNAVARLFRETDLPSPVVDPVIISSSGQRLMEQSAIESLISEMFPLARLLTPNIPEAETLTGMSITSEEGMRHAASRICEMGARAVLIKGGHLKRQEAEASKPESGADKALEGSEDAIDVLDDEGRVTVFRERRVSNVELHGSGCILSAAIAACLGKEAPLEDSVRSAKSFVAEAIRNKLGDNATR